MSMTFEQPKHLNVVSYQRSVTADLPVWAWPEKLDNAAG
jgi:hypothetical protein